MIVPEWVVGVVVPPPLGAVSRVQVGTEVTRKVRVSPGAGMVPPFHDAAAEASAPSAAAEKVLAAMLRFLSLDYGFELGLGVLGVLFQFLETTRRRVELRDAEHGARPAALRLAHDFHERAPKDVGFDPG